MDDLLVDKAIYLREHLHQMNLLTDEKRDQLLLSETAIMSSVEKACQACVEMGEYFLKQQNREEARNTHHLFETLVEQDVIEPALSKRLLSLISFGKLLSQASLIKGKSFSVKLKKQQLEDMHRFTQNLLLA